MRLDFLMNLYMKQPRFRLWDKTLKIVNFEWRHPKPSRSKFRSRHLRLLRTEFSSWDIRDPRVRNFEWDIRDSRTEFRVWDIRDPRGQNFKFETSETLEVGILNETFKSLEVKISKFGRIFFKNLNFKFWREKFWNFEFQIFGRMIFEILKFKIQPRRLVCLIPCWFNMSVDLGSRVPPRVGSKDTCLSQDI